MNPSLPTSSRAALALALGWIALGAPQPAAQQATSPPVVVSATASGTSRAEISPGWPLLVTVDLLHERAFQGEVPPVTIAEAGGSWSGSIRLLVTDGGGQEVVWPFHLAYAPPGPLTLDAQGGEGLGWWLSPEETAVIPPGTYALRAGILPEALGGVGVWSTPVVIEVRAGPRTSTPEGRAELGLLLAAYYVLRQEEDEALAAVEALLAEQPEHLGALSFQSGLLARAGRVREALAALERALGQFYALYPDAEEPPFTLLNAQHRLTGFLEEATSFEVTLAEKAPVHPHYGEGAAEAFALDGLQGAELVLERGVTYAFRMRGVPAASAFYLSTSATGAGAEPYTEGVEGTPASGTGEVLFTPGPDTPDFLYYQSVGVPYAGWRLRIAGGEPGTPGEPGPMPDAAYVLSPVHPNPFGGEARFTLRVSRAQRLSVDLLDLLGRPVRRLYEGVLAEGEAHGFTVSARGLPSGAYLLLVTGEDFRAVQKVTALR